MQYTKLYEIPGEFTKKAHINAQQYHDMYQQSVNNPVQFWSEQATQFITWLKLPKNTFAPETNDAVHGDWFDDGQLNACYNCVDRHLETRKNKIALIWEGNLPDETQSFTYGELHQRICQFANVLKAYNVQQGDRVCIYLPMIPEAVIAMLACARIGAIHSVVFAGFSPDALATRLLDADCSLLITADEGVRGEKIIELKNHCDNALMNCPKIKTLIVVKRTGSAIPWQANRDVWYHEAMSHAHTDCPIVPMHAQAPLFILYTSGSTGKPKGVLHSTGGYLLYVAMTYYYIFDYHESDIHWCTADIGWITGHSYLVYGPLANGATTVLFEGIPNYPDYSRYWNIIDKYHVTTFYTAPTALRSLRQQGDTWVTKTSRSSLKLLGTVGEIINPDVWEWYYRVVGNNRCPIVNTWWQTETGGIMLSAFPGATPLQPGSAGVAFFGIVPEIVNNEGLPVKKGQIGKLVIKSAWPGLMQTIYGNRQRFIQTYFTEVLGAYLTGDNAYQDESGQFIMTGREDDVIKVSGHRISTAEIENALISHADVSEAAVVGTPHPIKGESIYAFVTLNTSIEPNHELKQQLIGHVRNKIGPLATPERIQWTPSLPKTRSGKIMRRILHKIASNDVDNLGDLSTLADPSVLTRIITEKETQNES
jgi:acetyl-CoA synthetase